VGDYLIPVKEAQGNLIYTAGGRIWANYLLAGINVSPYMHTTVTGGQERNKALFHALSTAASSDMLLLGIKAKTAPDEIIKKVLTGIPNLDEGKHGDLLTQIDAFYSKLTRGEIEEFRRLYVLSVEIPTSASGAASTVAKISGTDPFANIDRNWVARKEAEIFGLLPPEFSPQRTTPGLLSWVHERMRLRGIEVPSAPTPETEHRFNSKGFTNILVDKVADTRPVFDEFCDAVATGEVRSAPKGIVSRFRENFASTRWGQQLAVYSPESRTESMPDGPASFQTLMAIESFPTIPKNALNTFTYIVDQEIGVDADFALRFSFSQEAISVDETRRFLKTLGGEIEANALDEFDDRAYGDRARERRLLQEQVTQETNARGMEVAAMFAFAHPNRDILSKQVRSLKQQFEGNGFEVTIPVGGQFELLKMMMPGSSCTKMGQELKGTTTVHGFSACLPVRSSHAGDLRGMPIAVNKENALGQIILHDYYGATEGGSGSIAVTGDQGSGKSYAFKNIVGHMSDLKLPAWVIDQSEHGEYVVFGQKLGSVDVVDVNYPECSIDPLKILPPDKAGPLFLDLMLPLLGLSPSSPEARLLGHILKPVNREVHGINSSRDLIDYLRRNNGTAEGENLHRQLEFWADQKYTHVLFDPLGQDNRVRVLPAFTPTARTVVFRTHGVKVFKGELRDDTEPSRRFGRVLYTAIAALTAYHFSLNRDPCAFIADEVSFLSGSNVLETLVREPDRVGRKARNFVVAGTQLATDLQDGNYDLIKKKIILRQENRDNAIAAFSWIGIPPTETMIERMTTQTSPRDPLRNNRTIKGREGEGWLSDGASIVRVKMLKQMSGVRHDFANTTASEMIRVDELPVLAESNGHV
jgi:AAA-like domain